MKNLLGYVWDCCQINTDIRPIPLSFNFDNFQESLKSMSYYYGEGNYTTSPWEKRRNLIRTLGNIKWRLQIYIKRYYLDKMSSPDEFENVLGEIDERISTLPFQHTDPLDAFLGIYAEVLQEEQSGVLVEEENSVIQSFY